MKFALIQLENKPDVFSNFTKIKGYVEHHPDVDCFVLPECALTGYNSKSVLRIDLDHPVYEKLVKLAVKYDSHIFVGAMTSDHISYYHISDKIEIYNKCHLGAKEERLFQSGDKLRMFTVDDVKIGTALCIESHIPDITQSYALSGAEVILMPFATPDVCGERKKLWSKYLPARAYDNGVYVLACNLTGQDFSGGLSAYDYKGDIILESYETKESIQIVNLDFEGLRKRKQSSKVNFLNRRKPMLYRKDDYGIY